MDEKLNSVIERTIQLSRQNQEFREELRKRLGFTSSANVVMDNERINQIYEYCIESILRKQAENFYEPFFTDFPEKSLLVDDYVSMEHERHRDRFDYYSLCLWEQIERLINAILSVSEFKTLINKKGNKLWDELGYENKGKYYTIGNTIWGEDKIEDKYLSKGISRAENNNLWARDKIRIVLFFMKYFVGSSPFNIYRKIEYDALCESYRNIYICRNTIHRGEEQSEKDKRKIRAIHMKTSSYYFEFNWLLTEFVRLTNDYKTIIKRIIVKLTKEDRAVVSSILGSVAFIKIESDVHPTQVPDDLFPKIKGLKRGDSILVTKLGGNISDIKPI